MRPVSTGGFFKKQNSAAMDKQRYSEMISETISACKTLQDLEDCEPMLAKYENDFGLDTNCVKLIREHFLKEKELKKQTAKI